MRKGGQVLLLTTPEGKPEVWGSLTEICREHEDLNLMQVRLYNKDSFPVIHTDAKGKDWMIERLLFRTKAK